SAFATCDEVQVKKMLFPLVYSRVYYNSQPDRMARLSERRSKNLPSHYFDALIRTASSTQKFNVVDRLKQISAPTLICGAEEDHVTPLYYQNLIYEKVPGARRMIFQATGHSAIFEQPER
ncbi:alpha/beta fold hydrolase, partial [Bacillus licheniformis]